MGHLQYNGYRCILSDLKSVLCWKEWKPVIIMYFFSQLYLMKKGIKAYIFIMKSSSHSCLMKRRVSLTLFCANSHLYSYWALNPLRFLSHQHCKLKQLFLWLYRWEWKCEWGKKSKASENKSSDNWQEITTEKNWNLHSYRWSGTNFLSPHWDLFLFFSKF